MGRNLTQLTELPTPLGRVLDRVMSIPRGARIRLANVERKVVVLLDGKVRAWVNNRVVGELGAGDALIVPGPCTQLYEPMESRREMRMQALVVTLAPEATGLAADFWEREFGRCQVRRAVMNAAAEGWLDALRAEAGRRGEDRGLRAGAYAWLLLTEIARGPGHEPTSPARTEGMSRGQWVVSQVRDYLAERHAGAVSLNDVAWHLRMSAEHVARTFRAETGGTVFAELERQRLARACHLLTGTNGTLTEVAARSGLGSATQLCRVFRRVHNETPQGYRRRVQAEAVSSPSEFEMVRE